MSDISYSSQIRIAWKENWKHTSFRFHFLFTLALILGLTQFFPLYFDYLEARNGTMLNDVVLNLIPAHDVSMLVFFFLYTGVFICFLANLIHPRFLVVAFQTYAFVTIMRIVSLYFIHLDPPTGYICLREPVISQFFSTNGAICSKDLFFSGHVSSILSIYFSVNHKKFKTLLLICVVMISLFVMIQHVHYTIDVIAAYPFTWLCYRFSKKLVLKSDLTSSGNPIQKS